MNTFVPFLIRCYPFSLRLSDNAKLDWIVMS